MLDEFTQFLRKANALAVAVAVIIGTAIGKVGWSTIS